MSDATRVIAFFLPGQAIKKLTPIGGGNVNDSWKVQLTSGKSFILQRLSPAVFSNPALVMANLQRVTEHLHNQLQLQSDFAIQVPELLHAPTGAASSVDDQGCHWRMLSYINNSRTLTTLASSIQAREVGRMLGCFHMLLATLDPAILDDPLPGFHVTPKYLQHYDAAHKKQTRSLSKQEQHCADLIEQSRPQADILERNRNLLTTIIIHGDPKVANFLFALECDTAISLIDLDTVMPGLLLHDLGDCLRSCCNSAGEELNDPAQVFFDPDLFTAILQGYCSQAGELLNEKDRELLIDAVWLICFELGLRFFSDHLDGNHYFKIQRANHNLHRALVQFNLAASVLKQRDRLKHTWQLVYESKS